MGGVPGPFDCFLVLRGLRTLPSPGRATRGERRCGGGVPGGARRHRAGALPRTGRRAARPPAARAGAAADGRPGGGMVSFVPRAGGRDGRSARDRAVAVCETTRIFTLAESLGGVESLIELPAVMTHASVAGLDPRGARGARPPVGRDRGCGRPDRRPATRARRRLAPPTPSERHRPYKSLWRRLRPSVNPPVEVPCGSDGRGGSSPARRPVQAQRRDRRRASALHPPRSTELARPPPRR